MLLGIHLHDFFKCTFIFTHLFSIALSFIGNHCYKAESYEEAFAKIEAATGIHDIDKVVHNFIQAEENNFALFKFVNDLSNEIEILESQISEMQEELERNRGAGQSTDNHRRRILKELEEKLSKTEMKAE